MQTFCLVTLILKKNGIDVVNSVGAYVGRCKSILRYGDIFLRQ